jgi:hypothetical protein
MPTIKLPELLTKYNEIVKNSDGLISAAPSCVRALDKLGVGATQANLKAAGKALEAQSKQATEALAKGGDKAAKVAKQFEQGMDELESDIKKLSKAVAEINALLA